MTRTISTMLATVLVLSAPAFAKDGLAQDNAKDRFRLEKTDSGFVRLDTQSGAMTLCRDEGGQMTCRMAADERAAYEQELDLLEKRVSALEKQAGSTAARQAMPSEDEIETTLSIMERFMRRFMGLVEEFKDDKQTEPGRT